MIIFDNETTNLTVPAAAPIEQQPCVMEFAAIKVDDKLCEIARMEFLCDPRRAIPLEAVRITGITNDAVKGKPPYLSHVPAIVDFFLGERELVAHNLAFDVSVTKYELMRIDRVTSFPWPPKQICTVEATIGLKGYRLRLGELYEILTGKSMKEAHRAMVDVEALLDCVRVLRKRKMI